MKPHLFLLTLLSLAGFSQRASGEGLLPARIDLKSPGNPAATYHLQAPADGSDLLQAGCALPVEVRRTVTRSENGETTIRFTLTARERICYRLEQLFRTEIAHDDALFYLPGFWYRRNLRSPETAPSFHTSDSWQVREDRLSTPLSGIYDEHSGLYYTILRRDKLCDETLPVGSHGEVVLTGRTSLGFTGFRNDGGQAALVFGFPWSEAPKSYRRKLTLAPAVAAFEVLEAGETRSLTWTLRKGSADTYSSFVAGVWNDSFDALAPEPLAAAYTPEEAKEHLSEYFIRSYVDQYPLKYLSGVELRTADPRSNGIAEVGFIGRVLLNAFNALEYGEQTGRRELVARADSIFASYLRCGFTPGGLLREVVDFQRGREPEVYSIRRQSEGAYALLLYLDYERRLGRRHTGWEARVQALLDRLLQLQQPDGSFPRKFRDDLTVIDASGGSTPSATLPLTIAHAYFRKDAYRTAARRTAAYLEHELIAAADYFSSTLDANCEDKEASLYAATAMYYLALDSKGAERRHYTELCREAAYFALSWYYLWDVPFAQGQMLGDAGFRSRGWGNVSVENNHVDVFVFEFADVLDFLAENCGESRFARMAALIRSSMLQLLPVEGSLFGIGCTGYYPEVVQHTAWDYGKNGKGFYNDIFAPGWTTASLWQLLSPDRTRHLFPQSK